jgi:hypothetical protein
VSLEPDSISERRTPNASISDDASTNTTSAMPSTVASVVRRRAHRLWML